MSFEDAVRSGGAVRVGFVAALKIECASLHRQAALGGAWQVRQSGPGATRAAAAATRAIDSGARVLVSWGLAGGLDAALVPGSVVAPRHVVPQGGVPLAVDAAWHSRLRSLGDEFNLHYGDLLTVPAALESPDAKRAAAAAAQAVAVDMESAAIASVAARARVPFVALRVIVDALDDALPGGAEGWIDERGNRRFAAVLRAVVSPSQWRPLVTLASRYRVASGVLDRLARALARRGVLALEDRAPRRAGS
jgi:adenosylhomocysteine nucleosidase